MAEDSSSSEDAHYSNYEEEEAKEDISRSQSPEWNDVEPTPFPQKPNDPFFILYSEDFIDTYGYFMTLMNNREVSQRGLELAEKVIEICGDYNGWWYKFYILERMPYDFEKELQFINTILLCAPKSYQAWHFRQWLVNRLDEPNNDFKYLSDLFRSDPKNFHAWSYANWFANKWNKFDELYNLANVMINIDVYNNSAWNTRKIAGAKINVDIKKEFDEASLVLEKTPNNEPALNFICSICDENPEFLPKFGELVEKLITQNPKESIVLQMKLYYNTKMNDTDSIIKICEELIDLDPVRTNYYKLVASGKLKYA